MSSRLKLFSFCAALVGLLPFLLGQQVETRCQRWFLETDESLYGLPAAPWMVPLSLGYREALAGLVWTRVVVYYGEQAEKRGQGEHLEQYISAVTTLDPYFRRAYLWGSMAAIYAGTIIHEADVRLSIDILERGLRFFPDDGEMYFQLGFQRYVELRPFVSREQATELRRQAADDFCTAALLGGGPAFSALLCARVANDAGLEPLGQERLVQSLLFLEDENIRRRIRSRLNNAANEPVPNEVLEAMADWRNAWQQQLPYAPSAFFGLTGSWPLVPVQDQVELPLPGAELVGHFQENIVGGSEDLPASANASDSAF